MTPPFILTERDHRLNAELMSYHALCTYVHFLPERRHPEVSVMLEVVEASLHRSTQVVHRHTCNEGGRALINLAKIFDAEKEAVESLGGSSALGQQISLVLNSLIFEWPETDRSMKLYVQ